MLVYYCALYHLPFFLSQYLSRLSLSLSLPLSRFSRLSLSRFTLSLSRLSLSRLSPICMSNWRLQWPLENINDLFSYWGTCYFLTDHCQKILWYHGNICYRVWYLIWWYYMMMVLLYAMRACRIKLLI